MSLGFNPFYNNKKLTAVSQGSGLCGVGLIGECRRSMSYTPSLATFMATKYASLSWVIFGRSWTTSPGVSRFSRWPGAGPAYIDSRRGAYRGHQHRHPHWTQVSRTGSLLCIRTRRLVFAVDVEHPHLLSPVNILWQPLLLLSLRCRIRRTNRYFAWSNICNLDMAGRRLDRRKSLPQWRRIYPLALELSSSQRATRRVHLACAFVLDRKATSRSAHTQHSSSSPVPFVPIVRFLVAPRYRAATPNAKPRYRPAL